MHSFLLIKLQREKTVKCSFYNNTSLQAEIWCFLMIPKNCITLIRIIEYGRTDLFAKSWTGFITFASNKVSIWKKKLFFELVPTPTCIWNWKIIGVEKKWHIKTYVSNYVYSFILSSNVVILPRKQSYSLISVRNIGRIDIIYFLWN